MLPLCNPHSNYAGGWKPVLSVPDPILPTEIAADRLLARILQSNSTEEASDPAAFPTQREVSRSRSASREPEKSPERADCSEVNVEEQNSSSPAKMLPSSAEKRSPSRSPPARRKLSRSTSSPRRSKSKSVSRKKHSRFVGSSRHHRGVKPYHGPMSGHSRFFFKTLSWKSYTVPSTSNFDT